MKIHDSLMKLEELMTLLGYKDLRTIKGWCSSNKVPIIPIGSSRFVHSWTVEIAILKEIQLAFARKDMDGAAVVSAIVNDNKQRLAELMESKSKKKPSSLEPGGVDKLLLKYKKKSKN